MKVSELQQELERFKKDMGDKEVQFWVSLSEESDPEEFELDEIHDGYNEKSKGNLEDNLKNLGNDIICVCEIRLSHFLTLTKKDGDEYE